VPNTARHDLSEIVGSALRRAGKILIHHKVSLELAADLPMLELDAVLFEQVLFNLLDNAAKYAPPDTTISIRAMPDRGQIALQIMDEGNAFHWASWKRVRQVSIARRRATTSVPAPGLGLAISRGFVEAMHARLRPQPGRPHGAVLTIRLPIPTTDSALDTAA